MKLALFDLDHTLLPIDSNNAWYEFEQKLGWDTTNYRQQQYQKLNQQYNDCTLDIHEYIDFSTQLIKQQGSENFKQALQQFLRQVIQPLVLPAAVNLIRQHQQNAEQVIIVSATNILIVQPIAQLFGVDQVLAIENKLDENGWISGKISGVPSFRQGKVIRVEQWLAKQNKTWQDVEFSSFYSDSVNDLFLLEKVDKPVAVNPDASLNLIAQQKGWEIYNLFNKI